MKRILMTLRSGLACVVAATTLLCSGSYAGDDSNLIRGVLMAAFDKPEARLVVEPIVVAQSHAIADWIQADRGGRALLKRSPHGWALILCSGDAIKSADALQRAGVSPSDAVSLSSGLMAAEAEVPPARRILFSSFEGTVEMGQGAHAHH
jgi:hypothetical protein